MPNATGIAVRTNSRSRRPDRPGSIGSSTHCARRRPTSTRCSTATRRGLASMAPAGRTLPAARRRAPQTGRPRRVGMSRPRGGPLRGHPRVLAAACVLRPRRHPARPGRRRLHALRRRADRRAPRRSRAARQHPAAPRRLRALGGPAVLPGADSGRLRSFCLVRRSGASERPLRCTPRPGAVVRMTPSSRPARCWSRPVTNVGWTPIFPRAVAIVTDVGAPLSHAAIVACELGVSRRRRHRRRHHAPPHRRAGPRQRRSGHRQVRRPTQRPPAITPATRVSAPTSSVGSPSTRSRSAS